MEIPGRGQVWEDAEGDAWQVEAVVLKVRRLKDDQQKDLEIDVAEQISTVRI